jgi:hypothetical protein
MNNVACIHRGSVTVASYNLVLPCGCTLYVACHPATRVAHTRIIEQRSALCRERRHEIGARISLWELLPNPEHRARVEFVSDEDGLRAV